MKLPQLDICACVHFVRLLHLTEFKVIARVVVQLTWAGELLHEGGELVVVPAVIVELNEAQELNFDALMLQFVPGPL